MGIVRGAEPVSSAARSSTSSSVGLLLLSAAVDILLGVLFVTHPGRSALNIAFVLGLTAFVWGIALIALGVITRRNQRGRRTGSTRHAEPAAG